MMRNPIIPPPISLTSEVERMRASSESAHRANSPRMQIIVHDHIELRNDCITCEHNQAVAAHRYAERCQLQSVGGDERRHLAAVRLTAIVSMCAELSRQLAELEREALAIADVLAG